jgi:DNA-binding NarL/FixJ family response regulator
MERHSASLAALRLPESPVRHLLVVDDYVPFAEALACRLNIEPGLAASATTTVEQTRTVLRDKRFDVILVDIDLDGRDGIELASEAQSDHPDVRIVVVTAGRDESRIIDAVRIGVSGWVVKDEPIEHLLSVVWGSLRGETWIPPRLLTHVLADLTSAQNERAEHEALLARLSMREKQILGYLAAGMSTDVIAGRLFVSRNTVRTHVYNMMRKLDVHSALAAVALARRAGLPLPGSGRLELPGLAGRWSSSRPELPPAAHRLTALAHREALVDAADVVFHRLLGDDQLSRDLPVGQTLSDEPHDLELAGPQTQGMGHHPAQASAG